MGKIKKGNIYKCTKPCCLPIIDNDSDKLFIVGNVVKAIDDDVVQDSLGNKCECNGYNKHCFEPVIQTEEVERVSHPSHYNKNGVECFDVIKAAIGDDGFESFCYGNVLKYLFRARHKGNYNEDLKKASFYLNEIIKKNGL